MSKELYHVQPVVIVRNGKYTIAFGMYEDGVQSIPFAGVAAKCPTDKENPARGVTLALGSAFKNLGRKMVNNEWKKIKAQYHQKLSAPPKQINAHVTILGEDGSVVVEFDEKLTEEDIKALKN